MKIFSERPFSEKSFYPHTKLYTDITLFKHERCGGKKTFQKKASQKNFSRKKSSADKKASHEFYVKRPQ